MKVTIGVPTFNRKALLEIMAASLYKSNLSASPNIRIYDDCSTDYGREFLGELFPSAKSIIVNKTNLKADKNIYQMYADFLSTGDDYFFNADSDIIFTSQWLNIALETVKKTDGVLSLFNSNSHCSYKILDDELCLKNTIGSAGTLLSRERMEEMLSYFKSIKEVKGFDWQWSEYFTNNGIRIYCLNKSLVQHIGYDGQNTGLYFDIGKNFKIESIEDGQIISDIFEKSMSAIMVKEKKRNEAFEKFNREIANNFKYNFKRCVIIIVKKLIPNAVYEKLKKTLKRLKRRSGELDS
jgi:glycosyltransferase involved in cell wall biosynthesis